MHYYPAKGIGLLFNEDLILRDFTTALSHTLRTCLGEAVIISKDTRLISLSRTMDVIACAY